jgi:hypothetical protein
LRIPHLRALKQFLRQHPGIRTRNPRKNRLEIHAGDLVATIAKHPITTADPLDADAGLVDAVLEIARRKNEVLSATGRG